jgi:ABC-type multidrug transport system fused ATPase/permease subunit
VPTLLRLTQFVRPYWGLSVSDIIIIVVLSSFRLGPAYFIKLIIDQAVPQHSLNLLSLYLVGLVIASLATNGLVAIETYIEQYVGQKVIFDLRSVLYAHLQSQSMSFYDNNQTGQLMSRVTNDVSQIQFFVTQGFARLVNTIVTVGLNITILFLLDPVLALVTLLVAPPLYLFQVKQAQIMAIFRKTQQRMADLNIVIQENVAGIKLIQAYGREPHEAERFDSVNRDIRSMRLHTQINMAFVNPGQEFVTMVNTVLILTLGAYRVIHGDLSIGSLVAFQSYTLLMWQPVRWIAMVNQMAQQAIAAGERVFEIMDTPLDVAEKPDAVRLPKLQGAIRYEHVSFAYGQNRVLLRDVSFEVAPGQTVALVGPSGSGKSTLTNLIPRFYDVTEGKVEVDGYDVRDVRLESLRSQIGMVLQEPFLFNMSVRENICYGRLDATEEEVIAAAKAACAHDFIMEFPNGYETEIGERGTRLSGGQRQRLSIARAILVNPRILILDEATSSVDTRTDYLIQHALDALMQNRTTLVIAHRLSTVQRADLILLMADGKIIARGTHQELLASNVAYQQLYEIQFQLQREGTASAMVEAAG